MTNKYEPSIFWIGLCKHANGPMQQEYHVPKGELIGGYDIVVK